MWPSDTPPPPIPIRRACPRCDEPMRPGRRLACELCQQAAEVAAERAGPGVTVTPAMIARERPDTI